MTRFETWRVIYTGKGLTQHFSNLVILHTYLPMKMEQTQCSETSAYRIQTTGNHPEESIKGKVKFTLLEALRLCTGRTAHRGSRGTALPFLDHAIRRGEGSASRLGRSLPPEKTRYPLYRRLGGPQGRSGQVPKISPHRDSIPGPSRT
jgi:hypothetical protein